MLRYFYLSVCICVLALSSDVNAQLTVDSDLGTLSLGTTDISGDTATGTNQVDYYNLLNPVLVYGNENVYQFTVAETVLFTASSVALTGDPDFILLDGLGVERDAAGKIFAEDTITTFFLEPSPPPETGPTIILSAGTYYLVAAAFHGIDGMVIPADGSYELQLTLAATPPAPPAIDLGNIADTGVAFTIDTFGSTVADPELALWTEGGILVALNDNADFPSDLQAQLDLFLGLPAGNYILAVGGFNTFFGQVFTTDSTSTEAGDYTLNYNGQTTTGTLAAGGVDFYSFTIGGTVILGDCDLNGTVNFFDIQPFVEILSGDTFLAQADCNQDGVVNFFDIQFFVEILANANP